MKQALLHHIDPNNRVIQYYQGMILQTEAK